MGREVRMVPNDWEHPRDKSGKYIPLHYRKSDWVSDGPPQHDVGVMPQWREEERNPYHSTQGALNHECCITKSNRIGLP